MMTDYGITAMAFLASTMAGGETRRKKPARMSANPDNSIQAGWKCPLDGGSAPAHPSAPTQ